MPGKKKGKGGDSSAEPTPASTPRDDSAADDDEEEAAQGNARDGGDISKVTDYVEQKEMDEAKASQALQNIMADRAEEAERKAAEAARERELATVSIEQVRESAVAAFFFWHAVRLALTARAMRVRRRTSTSSPPRWSSTRTPPSGRCASTVATPSPRSRRSWPRERL